MTVCSAAIAGCAVLLGARQHARATQHDSALLEQLDRLLAPGTHRVAHHYLAATEPSQVAPSAEAEVGGTDST
jgi:hypothetical protein